MRPVFFPSINETGSTQVHKLNSVWIKYNVGVFMNLVERVFDQVHYLNWIYKVIVLWN